MNGAAPSASDALQTGQQDEASARGAAENGSTPMDVDAPNGQAPASQVAAGDVVQASGRRGESAAASVTRVLQDASLSDPSPAEHVQTAYLVFGEALLSWLPLGELSHVTL